MWTGGIFRSYGELYEYLKAMTESEALERLAAVKAFLASPESLRFSTGSYAGVICAGLTGKPYGLRLPQEESA